MGFFIARQGVEAGFSTGIRSWLKDMYMIPSPTPALQSSTYAIALAKIGNATGNQALLRESLKVYTKSLNLLQLALYDEELMYSDETLGATLLLAIYEVMQCPSDSRRGYINHANGCGKLIQLRGPHAHVEGLGHAIFIMYRLMGVRAFRHGKA